MFEFNKKVLTKGLVEKKIEWANKIKDGVERRSVLNNLDKYNLGDIIRIVKVFKR